MRGMIGKRTGKQVLDEHLISRYTLSPVEGKLQPGKTHLVTGAAALSSPHARGQEIRPDRSHRISDSALHHWAREFERQGRCARPALPTGSGLVDG